MIPPAYRRSTRVKTYLKFSVVLVPRLIFTTTRTLAHPQLRLLKNKKKSVWKQVCSNLNPSSSLKYLWQTAKRFKNCIQSSTRPLNDDWFDDFCSKVAPCYVPSITESSPRLILNAPFFLPDHCLNLPLTHG